MQNDTGSSEVSPSRACSSKASTSLTRALVSQAPSAAYEAALPLVDFSVCSPVLLSLSCSSHHPIVHIYLPT